MMAVRRSEYMNGLRKTYEGSRHFWTSMELTCTIRYFSKDQLVDGNLYQCLEDREVDMLWGIMQM